MRVIKFLILSVISISLVLLAISLLLPSHVRISRAINISAKPGEITPYLSDLQRWERWNVFISDSVVNKKVVSPTEISTDRLQIEVRTSKADSVSTVWTQPGGKTFTASFSCLEGGEVTVVQWYFDFHLNWYPWEKFGSIIYDEQMGPGMEKSLAQLKALVESSH